MGLLERLKALFRLPGGTAQMPPGFEVEPATTIAEVIARMELISASLPERDGVARFNRMYLEVTKLVEVAAAGHDFEDPEFLARLDVVFANLYFKALSDHHLDPTSTSQAWAPLIQTRASGRIAPIQFALAGMNAHINHDLVIALVETCEELGRDPARDSGAYRDFVHVNTLLVAAQEKVEPWLKQGLLNWLDRALGRADEALEMWSIERARQAAWVQAEALWALRHEGSLTDRFLGTLARTVGFAGRGLLISRPF